MSCNNNDCKDCPGCAGDDADRTTLGDDDIIDMDSPSTHTERLDRHREDIDALRCDVDFLLDVAAASEEQQRPSSAMSKFGTEFPIRLGALAFAATALWLFWNSAVSPAFNVGELSLFGAASAALAFEAFLGLMASSSIGALVHGLNSDSDS